jgi:hypothetical protein
MYGRRQRDTAASEDRLQQQVMRMLRTWPMVLCQRNATWRHEMRTVLLLLLLQH